MVGMSEHMNGGQIYKMTELERFLKLNYKLINKNIIYNIFYSNNILNFSRFDEKNNVFICKWARIDTNALRKPVRILAETKENALLQTKFLAKKFNLNLDALDVRKVRKDYKLIKIPCKINNGSIFEGYIEIDHFYYILKDRSLDYQVKVLNFLKNFNMRNSNNLNYILYLNQRKNKW